MVALTYALGIFELGLGMIFFFGALISGEGDEAMWVGTVLILAYCSLCLGVVTIAVGWILDRVLHVKRTLDQLLRATLPPAGGARPTP